MADQSVVSVVALEVSDGKEREFLALTGQLQALVRNKGYGTNQLLQDGSHPRRYYDIRIWRNADAAAQSGSGQRHHEAAGAIWRSTCIRRRSSMSRGPSKWASPPQDPGRSAGS